MDQLLPRFGDFYRDEILTRRFDYIVPIETKGMLLLEQVIDDHPLKETSILSRRAFDFIPNDALKNKKIALLDDLIVLGRTINDSEERLKKKEPKEISKFVFAILEDHASKKYRMVEDTLPCVTIDNSDFSLMIDEFSQLSNKDRPTSPDHIIVTAYLKNTPPIEWLFSLLSEHGDLVEYRTGPDFKMWSLHHPDFSPSIPSFTQDSGVDKIRIKYWRQTGRLELCPEIFPALNFSKDDIIPDEFTNKVKSLFDKDWQSEEIKLKNLYDCVTISMRTQLCSRLITYLNLDGLEVSHVEINRARLPMYYGNEIASELINLIQHELLIHSKEEFPAPNKESEKYDDSFNMVQVTENLLNTLYQTYLEKNVGESNRYQWESAGLNIEKLSLKCGYSKLTTSFGIEQLNDRGYSTPLYASQNERGKIKIERQYRSTEIGAARLES